jgi:Bacterial lectin
MILIYSLCAFLPQAHDYICLGNCTRSPLDNDCYQLTDEIGQKQVGAVWAARTLDVTKSFTIEAALYFGTIDGVSGTKRNIGADGIALVIQNEGPYAIGGKGGGMGWSGISPSIGVKFDTYQNNITSGDLAGDHIALIRDGKLTNGRLSPLIELGFNLEDGQFHNVTFEWDSPKQTVSVYVNGALTLTMSSIDLKSFLGKKNYAFPGFTSSTGESTNRHVVCIKSIRGEFYGTVAPHFSPPYPVVSDVPSSPGVSRSPFSAAPSFGVVAPSSSPSIAPVSAAPHPVVSDAPSSPGVSSSSFSAAPSLGVVAPSSSPSIAPVSAVS